MPGVVLGPEELPVEVLQFHPNADGVLVSTAGRTVKVWDIARQQPLTGTLTLEGSPSLAAPVWTTLPFSMGDVGSMGENVSRMGYNSVASACLTFLRPWVSSPATCKRKCTKG